MFRVGKALAICLGVLIAPFVPSFQGGLAQASENERLTSRVTLQLAAGVWQPYTGENLPHKGKASKVVLDALNASGIDASITIYPWARGLLNAYDGKVDGMVAIWRTSERAERIAMSDVYHVNELVFIKRADFDFRYMNLYDLSGLSVGVGRGYDYDDQFRRATNFVKVPIVSLDRSLNMLLKERLDLVISDRVIAQWHMDRMDANLVQNQLEILDKAYAYIPLHFGVTKKRPDHEALIEKFNAGLQFIRDSGTFHSIIAQTGY